MGTIRDELSGSESYEITIERAKEIVEEYYLSEELLVEEKLPYKEQKKRE